MVVLSAVALWVGQLLAVELSVVLLSVMVLWVEELLSAKLVVVVEEL